ncbi:MAG TPA: DUF4131 domain-containing protein, partial [Thermoleophilia bacterium]|nr:DUF4131 domain-containing protein [Thermoleophilia bacterium]
MLRFAPAHVALAAYVAGLCLSLTGWSLPVRLLAAALPAAVVPAVSAAGRLLSVGMAQDPWGVQPRRVIGGAVTPAVLRLAALASLLLVAGTVVGDGRLAIVRRSVLRPLLHESVPVQATVLTLPRGDDKRVQVTVRVTGVAGQRVSERAELELKRGRREASGLAASLVEGVLLEIPRARIEPLPEPRRGAFDYARYLERRGEHVVLA